MSKKYFYALAVAICQITNKAERKRTALLIGKICSSSNDRFDWNKWYDACEVEG